MRYVLRIVSIPRKVESAIKETRRKLKEAPHMVSVWVDGAFWAGIAEADYQEELRKKGKTPEN